MKKLLVAGALLLLASPSFSQNTYTAKAKALMAKMTLEEKIGQLNLIIPGGAAVTGSVVSTDVENKIKKGLVGGLFGITSPEKVRKAQELAVNGSRLHIPMIFGLDVIHGHKTIFPIPLGLSASWDMGLIEQSARIAAKEATADGLNWAFSPMVDIARDARWGRISEGSGEDPYLGGKIAQAMVRGYQGSDLSKNNTLMACVKHFALYGAAEAGREYNTVDMSRIQMYEYYLPPYKAAIDAGAGSIMSSFNVIDGVPATGNKWLLTDLLRKEWGFNGFVVSDYTSLNEMINHGMGDLQAVSALALKAGLDMDMVGEGMLTTLAKSLKEGKVTVADIDKACLRILEAKYKLGLFDDPYRYIDESRPAKEILTADNRAAARNIAAHSMVLLKNDKQVLPLKRSGTIALVGPLADNRRNMLGTWVVAGDWNKSVSVLEGFKNVAGSGVNILSAKGANITDDTAMFLKRVNALGLEADIDPRSPQAMIDEAVAAANKADVVVAVVGESANMSGESSSRADISLPASQQALLKALHKTGKPLVVVLINGRPLTLVWENEHATAILEAWAPGTEAGNAIADVLFGNYNPSGKLSATFPRSVGQIPIYYNHKNTGRPFDGTGGAKFKTSYLDEVNEPLYPFGYGLSYTHFDYSPVKLSKTILKGGGKLIASVTLTNSGKYAGEEVVQLYVSDPVASISRSVKDLKGFQKVMLQPGESKEVSFTVTTEELKFFNSELKRVWEPGKFVIHIGTSSSQVKSAEVEWNK
ncbi:MAG: beta-glucosidase BglX [Chitinophagaceae bacterium]|nr:beta-glucosidase BglX [Chitinophagaceae bacterium]MCA6456625.1 beta-glucosidase BglX [Chitinophagaceae bacterium]MCA6459271.1 beta-glucosidase BglX [Chitinophagaceae bacterium]MCA6464641.1 beta-glucosidase BglX [Chitinophagaceae bacterium]